MSEIAGVEVQPTDDADLVAVTLTFRAPLTQVVGTFQVYDRVPYLWTRKGRRKTKRMKGRRRTDPAKVQQMLAGFTP